MYYLKEGCSKEKVPSSVLLNLKVITIGMYRTLPTYLTAAFMGNHTSVGFFSHVVRYDVITLFLAGGSLASARS